MFRDKSAIHRLTSQGVRLHHALKTLICLFEQSDMSTSTSANGVRLGGTACLCKQRQMGAECVWDTYLDFCIS